MRNKGFFWFFTIVLAVVCIYQLSFTFIANGVESEAEASAEASVEELFASAAESDTLLLPNGTKVAKNDPEAKDLAQSAFVNDILKNKNEESVFLGSTYKDVKSKSIALGLDLKGGMSVTLQLSMPDLVRNYAVSPKIERFSAPFNKAVDTYNSTGGDFIALFAKEFKIAHPERPLIKEFSTEAVISEIGSKATDEQVINYLTGLADNALDGVETIMANRINQFGVAQPNITKDVESNRIYIELPGVKDQETVRARIQGSANLEFYHALKGTQVGGILNALATSEEDLLEALETETEDSTETALDTTTVSTDSLNLDDILGDESNDLTEEVETTEFLKYFRINASEEGFLPSPQLGYSKAADTAKVNQLIADRYDELGIENVLFAWGNAGIKLMQDNDTLYHALYALEIPEDGKARVGGADIDEARVGSNEGKIVILVDMTSEGQEEWKQMTTDFQPRGNQPNDFEFVAIAMDGKVFSAPSINSVIEGGSTEISGNFKLDEAQEIVNLLNGGALPAPVVIVEEAVVGPTIGAENASSGLISFAFALALVLVYMIFYYGKAGVVANIALIANIVFILGCLASFGAVLTLAGIAGIVLTIGMSVDANVLIFERIREEVAEGKGMKLAVNDGYKKALSSILDANITTLLVAFVLKSFG
ncbi:MAG: protein translocase subunit SecD, partial [Lishizhenia sp.]